MAERPISATGTRRSTPLYSQSNDIPEIARFKVHNLYNISFSLYLIFLLLRMKILFFFNSIYQVEQHEITKDLWSHR